MVWIKRILEQHTKDKNKLYALPAPEVECISKGKARTPYEFWGKVAITTTRKEGWAVGARFLPGSPYDVHTLPKALAQASILSNTAIHTAVINRGYRGVDVLGFAGQQRPSFA